MICGREWKVSPEDPVPCLSVSEPQNALDVFRDDHISSRGAQTIAMCPEFLKRYGGGQEIPPEFERRVPGLSSERDAAIAVVWRALRLAFIR